MSDLVTDWAGKHICGAGSRPEMVGNAKRAVAAAIEHCDAVFIDDAGCGDQSWILDAIPDHADYMGFDIFEWTPDTKAIDICAEPMAPADLIICRFVFTHLDADDILAALDQFRMASTYLLATQYDYGDNQGKGLPTGEGWDLRKEPFNLGEPIESWPDCYDRTLALWQIRK